MTNLLTTQSPSLLQVTTGQPFNWKFRLTPGGMRATCLQGAKFPRKKKTTAETWSMDDSTSLFQKIKNWTCTLCIVINGDIWCLYSMIINILYILLDSGFTSHTSKAALKTELLLPQQLTVLHVGLKLSFPPLLPLAEMPLQWKLQASSPTLSKQQWLRFAQPPFRSCLVPLLGRCDETLPHEGTIRIDKKTILNGSLGDIQYCFPEPYGKEPL